MAILPSVGVLKFRIMQAMGKGRMRNWEEPGRASGKAGRLAGVDRTGNHGRFSEREIRRERVHGK